MGIREHCENIIFVDLPSKEPQIVDELKNLNEIISVRNNYDVVIDFSRVEIFLSTSLSNLLILQNLLLKNGHRLILSNAGFATRCIFTVAGLTEQFAFVDDKFAALQELPAVGNT